MSYRLYLTLKGYFTNSVLYLHKVWCLKKQTMMQDHPEFKSLIGVKHQKHWTLVKNSKS